MLAYISLVLVVLLGLVNFHLQEKRPYRIEIMAVAVARDRVLSLGPLKIGEPQQEAYILRVIQPDGVLRESRYVKLYYQHRADEPPLPKDFFTGLKRPWRLTVERVYECDGTVRKMATVYSDKGESSFVPELLPRHADYRNLESIPLDVVLPCFFLETNYVASMKAVD